MANAQLGGNISIPTDISTIAQAIDSLNIVGVNSGGVVFNVAAGHTETSSNKVLTISTNPPTSLNKVTFVKSGSGTNPLITAAPGSSSTADGIIKINGADYVTFDGIDLLDPISNTGDQVMEWGYALFRADIANGTQNTIIRNCTITLQKISALSIGIYVANKDINGITINTDIPSGLNSYNKFYGNNISNVYKGIVVISATTINQKDFDNEVGVIGQASNSITNWGGSTISAEGIRCEGQVNIKINNNIVNGGAGTGGAAATVGIMATLFGSLPNAANYEISHNVVTISANSSSQAHYGIRALANGDTVRIHHNIIENCVSSQTTNSFNALAHDPVGTVNAAYIHDNIIRNNSHSGTGTSTMLNTGSASGSINDLKIYSNQIYGNQKTGVSGNMSCITVPDGSIECYDNQIYNNSIPNSSGTSASTIYGYFNSFNNPVKEKIYGNVIYNLTVGGFNTSSSSIIAGIRSNLSTSSTTLKEINNNIIYDLSSVSGNTTSGGVIGIWSSAGANTKIYSNKVYDLTNNGSSGTSTGVFVTSGALIEIRDNLIWDLKTPNSSGINSIVGIYSSSTTTNSSIRIFDNSIQLNASSSATIFGTSGVFVAGNATATTAAVDMRHNVIMNLSTPGTSGGFTTAYRRSSINLNNYAMTSDSNNFYAGTPAANRVIFYDGTNSDQTLAAYQTRVAPRDANSVSQISKTLNLAINLEACLEIDTITVEIRDTVSPYTVIDNAVGLGGFGMKQVFTFDNVQNNVYYYIVFKHRNSIQTWSKGGGERFIDGVLNYDFTTAASQAFGNNMISVGGKYSFYTGDVTQDEVVDGNDGALIDNDASAFVTGYVNTDLDCNSVVDGADAVYAENNAANFINVIKP